MMFWIVHLPPFLRRRHFRSRARRSSGTLFARTSLRSSRGARPPPRLVFHNALQCVVTLLAWLAARFSLTHVPEDSATSFERSCATVRLCESATLSLTGCVAECVASSRAARAQGACAARGRAHLGRKVHGAYGLRPLPTHPSPPPAPPPAATRLDATKKRNGSRNVPRSCSRTPALRTQLSPSHPPSRAPRRGLTARGGRTGSAAWRCSRARAGTPDCTATRAPSPSPSVPPLPTVPPTTRPTVLYSMARAPSPSPSVAARARALPQFPPRRALLCGPPVLNGHVSSLPSY
jgi:hypothetical protein